MRAARQPNWRVCRWTWNPKLPFLTNDYQMSYDDSLPSVLLLFCLLACLYWNSDTQATWFSAFMVAGYRSECLLLCWRRRIRLKRSRHSVRPCSLSYLGITYLSLECDENHAIHLVGSSLVCLRPWASPLLRLAYQIRRPASSCSRCSHSLSYVTQSLNICPIFTLFVVCD
jgi:hypothetical protein